MIYQKIVSIKARKVELSMWGHGANFAHDLFFEKPIDTARELGNIALVETKQRNKNDERSTKTDV
ncbi:hypothetical protein ASwh1_204 [Aeromonas phage Aswh_1]|nr:hypothetical protein ASwh1_204 [Aeromonas phage Aswh_1]